MTPFTAITLNYAVAITVNTVNEATLDPAAIGSNLRSAIKQQRAFLTGEDDHAVVDHFRIDYCGREPLASTKLQPMPAPALAPDHELDAEQLAARYCLVGGHPRLTKKEWLIDIEQENTLAGYYPWLLRQLRTEHENAVEQQTHTHVFDLRVTAPLDLDRDDVHDLLGLFSSAALDELQDTIAEQRADDAYLHKASATLKLNIEILP